MAVVRRLELQREDANVLRHDGNGDVSCIHIGTVEIPLCWASSCSSSSSSSMATVVAVCVEAPRLLCSPPSPCCCCCFGGVCWVINAAPSSSGILLSQQRLVVIRCTKARRLCFDSHVRARMLSLVLLLPRSTTLPVDGLVVLIVVFVLVLWNPRYFFISAKREEEFVAVSRVVVMSWCICSLTNYTEGKR